MLQPPHDLVPLIGSGSKFPPLKFHCCSGCIRHLRRCAGDHHHQYFLVNIDRCYFVRHVRLSGGEVADRASTFKYAPLRAIALPRGKATLNYWSTSAIRIKLPDGLRFSRALTTSATLSVGSIILAARASFHHLWWRAAPSQTPLKTPWGGPPGPRRTPSSGWPVQQRADQGVGRGRGRPPHRAFITFGGPQAHEALATGRGVVCRGDGSGAVMGMVSFRG